jgi:hypothetical protein
MTQELWSQVDEYIVKVIADLDSDIRISVFNPPSPMAKVLRQARPSGDPAEICLAGARASR